MSCSFEGCQETVKKQGLCSAHYRQKVRGIPLQPLQRLNSVEAKLATYSKTVGDCIIWTGVKQSRGYGRITISGERFLAHRIAYERKHGYVPEHLDVHHKCGNKLCINTDHLELLPHGPHMRLHNHR